MKHLLNKVCLAFKEHKVAYGIVGGYAVALHGVFRGTIDVDAIIEHSQAQFERCEKALKSIGLTPRLPVTAKEVFQFRKEYIEKRNMIAWSFINKNSPLEIVDIIITHDLSKCNTVSLKIDNFKVVVLSRDDLINMKSSSDRPQDREDVKLLRELK